MIRDLGRVGGGQAGLHAGRWAGGIFACLLLAAATPSAAVDEFAPVVKSYSECVQAYRARRTDYATYCRGRFPLTLSAATARPSPLAAATPTPSTTTPPATTTPPPTSVPTAPPSTSTQTPSATGAAPSRTPPREPIDVTPRVNQLIDAWTNRPRPPKPPPRPPADPLAVIPEIQAACAAYAGNAERWRRCTTDAWNKAGLRGQPPVVLQVPPAPPPVEKPPVVVEPTDQTPVEPPQVKPPPVRPRPVKPNPSIAEPPILSQPDPPVDVAPPRVEPEPPLKLEPQPPKLVDPPLPREPAPPSIPIWVWLLAVLVALVAAAAGGFGLSRWLAKAKPPARPIQAAPIASAPPQIALVADPGVVVLTPDGPPRAGLAVSMRFALDAGPDADAVRLDYPSLETAP